MGHFGSPTLKKKSEALLFGPPFQMETQPISFWLGTLLFCSSIQWLLLYSCILWFLTHILLSRALFVHFVNTVGSDQLASDKAISPDHSTNISWDHMLSKFHYKLKFNPCPAEPSFITVDPDQLASDKVSYTGSTLFSTLLEITYNWNA